MSQKYSLAVLKRFLASPEFSFSLSLHDNLQSSPCATTGIAAICNFPYYSFDAEEPNWS